MEIKLSKTFAKNLRGRFGKYEFEVGILEDGPHRDAKRGAPGLKGDDVRATYAGGPVRKAGRKSSQKISDISRENRKRLGFNYMSQPFKDKTSDVMKFSKEFFKLAFGRSQKKRAENLLQAVVRNPILAGKYGPQSTLTTIIKTFDRPMIDTGQLFKAIKARCRVK